MRKHSNQSRFRAWWRKSRRARRIATIATGILYAVARVIAATDYILRRWPLH
jgi:hypothetical protein